MLHNNYTCKDQIGFFFNTKTRYEPETKSLLKPLLFLFLLLVISVSSHLLIIPKDKY